MSEGSPGPSSTAKPQKSTFSASDYSNDVSRVLAHAKATGTATVTDADGRPLVIISIPTVDLPILDD